MWFHMLRLLIVDDEQIVLDSMKFIIEKYTDKARIVGTARSGREAIEKGLELKPDAIFMDIRMPGIHGIEAIRELKRIDHQTAFVIVSAYEYFDYAKEAIQLGVFDYLLKPIKKEQVLDILERLDIYFRNRHEEIRKQIELREKINKLIPYLKEQFLYTQIMMGRTLQDLSFYEEIFNMKLGRGFVLIASLLAPEENSKVEKMKQSLIRQRFYEAFSTELLREIPCLLGPKTLDRIIAYIPVKEESDPYVVRNTSIELVDKVLNRMDDINQGKVRVGIGGVYAIEDLTTSYEEANIAASIIGEERIIHYQDLPSSFKKAGISHRLIIHRFLGSILSRDEKSAQDSLNEWFTWLANHYADDLDTVKSYCIELYMHIIRLGKDGETNGLPFEQQDMMRLMKMESLNDIKVMLSEDLKRFFHQQKERENRELSGIMAEAVRFIKENYTDEEIALDVVAKKVNMSYHYFSKFFKESMGKTFVDYLTELRIKKAMELLQLPNQSIKEVCYLVGYGDPNYFSKIFKKTTGLTPSEYKDKMKG